jgi:flagellar protein FlgJ
MTANVSGSLASDARSLDALKTSAARDPKAAIRQAASQFEALFMQMVMKSMRDAVPKSGMLEGTGSDTFQSMLDTQFAQGMTGKPGGLGELIAKQLMRNMPSDASVQGAAAAMPKVSSAGIERHLAAFEAAAANARSGDGEAIFPSGSQVAAAAAAAARARSMQAPATRRDALSGMPMLGPDSNAPSAANGANGSNGANGANGSNGKSGAAPAAFVDRMWGAASNAQRATGVPAGFIVGQAALESGWGRQELKHADGRTSFNLFGIKAGSGWKGATVDASTSEFVGGKMIRTVERFRAYSSYEEAFTDWSRLMASNPRYAGVLSAGGSVESFAKNMQRAGYATDPNYASKLTSTITQALSLRRVTT